MRIFPLLGLALVACTSATTTASSGAGDAGEGGEGACQAPPGDWREGRDPPAHCIKEVTGKVTATGGAPLPGRTMTLCGVVCFGGTTDAAGAFRIGVNARLPNGGYAVLAHGRPRHASVFVRLPDGPPELLDLGAAFELAPMSTEGVALPPDDGAAATVTVGPVSLGVPAGTSWQLAFEDAVDDVDGRVLRFAKIPAARAQVFAEGAVAVYALTPFEATPSKPVSLSLADTGGLAAGAAVEVLVMEGVSLEPENRSGLGRVAATGRVSTDGARIETDPGQGIDRITWIAVRPKK